MGTISVTVPEWRARKLMRAALAIVITIFLAGNVSAQNGPLILSPCDCGGTNKGGSMVLSVWQNPNDKEYSPKIEEPKIVFTTAPYVYDRQKEVRSANRWYRAGIITHDFGGGFDAVASGLRIEQGRAVEVGVPGVVAGKRNGVGVAIFSATATVAGHFVLRYWHKKQPTSKIPGITGVGIGVVRTILGVIAIRK